jgi:ketosteroid isomerase-like protein
MSEKKDAIKAIIDNHLAAWNNTDPVSRQAAIATIYSLDVKVADPDEKYKGRETVDGIIAGFQAKFSGASLSLVGKPQIHHNGVYYKWQLAAAGAAPLATGVDFILLKDGLIKTLYVFVDKAAK